jgi:hypothetical protein
MKLYFLAASFFLLVGCGSTAPDETDLGASCTSTSACGPGLSCYAKGDEPSLCTRDCVPGASCGAGFVCSDTDLGTIGDASNVHKSVCVHTCSNAGRGDCGGVWVCNVGKGGNRLCTGGADALAASVRGRPRTRQQRVDRVRRVILHATEDVREVIERVDPTGFAGGHE